MEKLINEITELTQELMKKESTKENPDQINSCLDIITTFLGPIKDKIIIKRYSKNSIPSLIVINKDTKKPKIFFNGHIDVVSGDKSQFSPFIKDNRIYGRGAGDMKGCVAIMVSLFKNLVIDNIDIPIGLMITGDEEMGGTFGVKYILDEEGYSCDVAFVPDGGYNFDIVEYEKGALHLKISTDGVAGHGSKPWTGVNAIDKIINFYQKIKEKFGKPSADNTWQNTINIGKIHSDNNSVNRIPDNAYMLIDIRFTQKDDDENLLKLVNEICEGCKIEIITRSPLYNTPSTNEYMKIARDVTEDTLGHKVKFSKEDGASDARYFCDKQIPAVIMKPLCGESHSNDEWIDIDSMVKFYEILKSFVYKSVSMKM